MKLSILFTFLICASCVGCGYFGKKDNKPQDTIQPLEELRKKAALYTKLTRELEDKDGVLSHFRCDSLLFQSIYEVSTDGDLDLTLYEGAPGQWFRTKAHDCILWNGSKFVSNGSTTTISRDQIIGLLTWIWDRQDLEMLKRLVAFGRKAEPRWWMGQGLNVIERESRTNLRGPLLGTMMQMLYKLGGEDDPARKFPYGPTGKKNGYQQHLEVTHTYLRGQIFGGVSDLELTALKRAAERHPTNAVYSGVYHYFKDGDQTNAIKMLEDESLFPTNRLPTEKDRCSDYIFQRDDDRDDPDPDKDDWKPCADGDDDVHPGVDFLWAFKVISK